MNNLKHIEINIGKACNNKCRFCMSAKSELWDIKFVKLEVLQEKLASYAERGYKSVGFLGGDISIHPKILDIIAYSKEQGYESINVISNGMKFDDMKFASQIVELGVTRINFSIHSHLPEVENYLIQVPGGLERKWEAVKNFQKLHKEGKLKDQLSINVVVNSKNYKTSVETALFYHVKMGVSDIRFNFMWLNNDMREYWDDLKFTYAEFLPYIKRLIYISEKYNIRITFDTVPACIFYKIDPINYRTLVKKYLGEEHDHIVEIDHVNNDDNFNWKERKKDMLKTQFDSCGKCTYRESCQGVWNGYVELFGESEFLPILPVAGEKLDIHSRKEEEKIMYSVSANPKFHGGGDTQNKRLNHKWCYEQIEKGNLEAVEKELIGEYKQKPQDEQLSNLYGVFLSSKKDYIGAIDVYTKLITSNNKIINKGDIYYNLGVNYVNIGENKKAGENLEKAKKELGDSQEHFNEYYKNFFKESKKFNYEDSEQKILERFVNDIEFNEVNNYMNSYLKEEQKI